MHPMHEEQKRISNDLCEVLVPDEILHEKCLEEREGNVLARRLEHMHTAVCDILLEYSDVQNGSHSHTIPTDLGR